MELLLETAEGLQTTSIWHLIVSLKTASLPAIDWLAKHGVDRILTHGGDASDPIEAHFDHLKQLIAHA